MDQPQNDDDQVRNDEAVDTGTTQDSVDETSTDGQDGEQSQTIPVTVVNNASDESPNSEETPRVDEAEPAVEEASPMAATDELASVASELSAMPAESESTEPQVDEGVPSGATEEEHSTGLPVFSPGSDPMDQVNADVEQTEGVQTPDGPAPQPEVMSEPPVEEDAPSMDQSSESTDSVAPEPPEDVIGQEPVVEDAPESHEAVSMANDAVLEQDSRKTVAGKLRSLIRIEYLWLAKALNRLFQAIDAETGIHRV